MSDRQEGESCILWSKCWLVKNDAPPNYAVRKLTLLQRCWKPQGKWKWEFLGLKIVEQALLHNGACQEIPWHRIWSHIEHIWTFPDSRLPDEFPGDFPGWHRQIRANKNQCPHGSSSGKQVGDSEQTFMTTGGFLGLAANFYSSEASEHGHIKRMEKSEMYLPIYLSEERLA